MRKKSNVVSLPKDIKLRARVSCVYPDGSLKVIIAVKDGEKAFVIDASHVVPEPVTEAESMPGGPPDDEPTPQPVPPDPEL